MRRISVIFAFGLAIRIHAEGALEKLSDKLVTQVIDSMCAAPLKALAQHQADLDDVALGMPADVSRSLHYGGNSVKKGPLLHLCALSPFAAASRNQLSLTQGPRGAVEARAKKKGSLLSSRAQQEVDYGNNWYEQTRNAAKISNTKQYMKEWREANRNDRRDLYTDQWDGDEYKGSPFNILTFLIVVAVGTPAIGIWFALSSYGTVWG